MSEPRPRVAFVSMGLGLGGTEKMMRLCATAMDRDRWDVHVIGAEVGGAREQELRDVGIPVALAEGDEDRLTQQLEGTDLVFVFRHGGTQPLVPAAARRAGVRALVEENIFGHVDPSPDEADFDVHLFMSQMCLLRYRDRLGHEPEDFHRRHKVLSSPVDLVGVRDIAPSPAEAKRRLGLDPDRPVVGRVGREADLKWRNLLVDMVPYLLRLRPDAQVLLVGTTPAKRARLRRHGVLDRVTLAEQTADPERLATYYAACDVFVSAGVIGESQGVAINEAQSLGVPVVTSSMPWVDNAQAEFVEHGRSGWYAAHPRPFAEAVADLLGDEAKRRAFGEVGRAYGERMLDPTTLGERLDALFRWALDGGDGPLDWHPSAAEVEAFAPEFARRQGLEFRPLTTRERIEVLVQRAEERVMLLRSAAGVFMTFASVLKRLRPA